MNRPLIIIGAGGHSKVLIDTLQSQAMEILGITDIDVNKQNQELLGIPIIGEDKVVFQYHPESVLLVNGIGRVDGSNHRQGIFQYFERNGYQFAQVIHQSAIVSLNVTIAAGAQIMAGAVVQPGSIIGANSIINTGTVLDHDTFIGSHVHIAPGVTISGGVRIDDGTLIGAGTTIIQGIKVGANSLVAAGSVVIRDVPEGTTVMGVPAKEAKSESSNNSIHPEKAHSKTNH